MQTQTIGTRWCAAATCAKRQHQLCREKPLLRTPSAARRVVQQPRSRGNVVTCRGGSRQAEKAASPLAEATFSVPPPEPQRQFTDTWQAKAATAGVLLVAALTLLRGLRRRNSMSDLEDRGYLDESRGNADPYLEDIMKNVNKVQYEELTDEQIAAARKRRARGIADYRKAEVEVPDNHPFATKKELSADEEELLRQRLAVKRGAPVQDTSGRRGYPGMEGLDGRAQQ